MSGNAAPPPLVARRLNGERIVLLGWTRAILMQLAHPLVAAGVLDHSSYRGSAYEAGKRLHHTVSAMLSLTFGDERERTAALHRIRGIHRRVKGTLREAVGIFPAGTPYSAEDPPLLLWVLATLLDSIAAAYQHLVEPLTRAELDAFCTESAPTLIDLGGDPAAAPRTWEALTGYMRSMDRSGVFAVTPATIALANSILSPRGAGVRVPFAGINRLVSIGLLPPQLREVYGFPWDAGRRRRFERALRIIRGTRALTPDLIARWPRSR